MYKSSRRYWLWVNRKDSVKNYRGIIKLKASDQERTISKAYGLEYKEKEKYKVYDLEYKKKG